MVDSSKVSTKTVSFAQLKQNHIWSSRQRHLHGRAYNNMQLLSKEIKYGMHSWKICEDFKMIVIHEVYNIVIQNNEACFLTSVQKNVLFSALVKAEDVFPLPRHFKLGIYCHNNRQS